MKILSILIPIGLSAVATSAPNGEIDRILANMERAAKSVKTMQARLVYEKRNTQIGGKQTDRGAISFKHVGPNKDKLRINYEVSRHEVSVDGDRVVLYQPRINQVIITSLKSLSKEKRELSFMETPYKSVRELKSQYEIRYAGEDKVSSTAVSVIDLIPRTGAATKKLTLWIDQSTWLPIKYMIVDATSLVSFTLLEMKTNVELEAGVFKIEWPSGTKVVKQ